MIPKPLSRLSETSIPGVFAYIQPNADFDPLTANQQELIENGFPLPPDKRDREVYEFWSQYVSRKRRRIIPELTITDVRHGPAQGISLNGLSAAGNSLASSDNWSGVVITDPTNTWRNATSSVFGEWIVPSVNCNGLPGGAYYSSQWVGIDGYGSPDVFQAGISADVSCPGGTDTYFWYEWFPNNETRISLPVAPGDKVSAAIYCNPGNVYVASLDNETQGVNATLNMQPPPGTALVGNCIEWIVERPGVNGSLSNLPKYGTITMYGVAWHQSGPHGHRSYIYIDEPNNPNFIAVTMDENGIPVSVPAVSGVGLKSRMICTCLL